MIQLLEDVRVAFNALMPDADFDVMEVCMATVLANRAGGDAVAVFLVGPSSNGKTEPIMALEGLADTYVLSTMNEKTLASGLPTKDGTSTEAFINKLPSPGTFCLKEFTSVLELRSDTRKEVISQLREMMDGYYRKPHGNGLVTEWRGRIGILAAVTEVIERHREAVSTMGDRWLLLRVPASDDRKATALNAMRNVGKEAPERHNLKEAVTPFMGHVGTPDLNAVQCSEGLEIAIAEAVDFLCRVRTPVARDSYSKQPTYIPSPEGPARAAKACYKLLKCLALVRGRKEVSKEELATLYRIVRDNIPSKRLAVLRAIMAGAKSTDDLRDAVGLSWSEVEAALSDLKLFGAVTSIEAQTGGRGRPSVSWSLTDDARRLFSLFPPLGGT